MRYLCSVLFPNPVSGGGVKRESGENPEQSRCCVLFIRLSILLPLPKRFRWEGGQPGASQKTCKTELTPLTPRGKGLRHELNQLPKRKRMRYALFLVLLAFEVVPLHLYGEVADTLLTQLAEQLDVVDVEGHVVRPTITAAMPTQQVSEKEMQSMGAQNVADVLRHFAGTNIKDYGGIGGMKTVSVRGLSASHTGICYDGIVVSNCQAGQVDIGRFPISNLSSITLFSGQNEDLAASARAIASGSLLCLSTKTSVKSLKEDNENRKGEVLLKAGSFGYTEASLFIKPRVTDSLSVNIFSDCTWLKGDYPYFLTNGTETTRECRQNTDLRSTTTEANIDASFHRYHTLAVKAYLTLSERGLPGAVILYNPYGNERLTDRNAFCQSQYTYQRRTWQFLARAKYNYAYDCYTDTNVKYEGGMQTDINRQDEYYLQATAVWRPVSSFGVAIAQDEVVNTLQSNLPACPFPTRLTSFTSLQARYEGYRLKLHGSLLGTYVKEQVQKGTNPDDLHKLTPMVSLSFRPWVEGSLFVRMMYKENYRIPSFNDLYYFRVGNKSLRPEWAREYNLGVSWAVPVSHILQELSVTADAYHNQVRDKIVAFPTTYVWKMANYGRVSINGIDVTFSAFTHAFNGWSANATFTYSYQRAIDCTSEGSASYGLQLPYTPVHSGSGHLQICTPWLRIGYNIVAASERYSLMEHSAHYRLDGYAEHSLSLAKTFTLRASALEAQAEALNFTGQQYEIIQYYPMPLQQYRITLKWKL